MQREGRANKRAVQRHAKAVVAMDMLAALRALVRPACRPPRAAVRGQREGRGGWCGLLFARRASVAPAPCMAATGGQPAVAAAILLQDFAPPPR